MADPAEFQDIDHDSLVLVFADLFEVVVVVVLLLLLIACD